MPKFEDFASDELLPWSDWMAGLRIGTEPPSAEVIGAGAEISRYFGGDVAGRRVSDLMGPHYWAAFEALCERMLERRRPLYIVGPFYYGTAVFNRMERIALPCGVGDSVSEVLLYWRVVEDKNVPTCMEFL